MKLRLIKLHLCDLWAAIQGKASRLPRITDILAAAVIVVLAMSQVGCFAAGVAPAAGQVEAIQSGSTLYGIRMAEQGAPGTFVFIRDYLITYVWPVAGTDGWGFAVRSIDPTKPATLETWLAGIGGKGNFVSLDTIGDLTKCLLAHGWQQLSKAAPAFLANALKVGATAEGFMIIMPVTPEMLDALPEGRMQQ